MLLAYLQDATEHGSHYSGGVRPFGWGKSNDGRSYEYKTGKICMKHAQELKARGKWQKKALKYKSHIWSEGAPKYTWGEEDWC